LANQLGIVRVRDMQEAETRALLELTDTLLDEVDVGQRFTVEDLRSWHRRWLGSIYPWAGEYRQVNICGASSLVTTPVGPCRWDLCTHLPECGSWALLP
jgi:cell filamentation protein